MPTISYAGIRHPLPLICVCAPLSKRIQRPVNSPVLLYTSFALLASRYEQGAVGRVGIRFATRRL
jgi:hypothetical protein